MNTLAGRVMSRLVVNIRREMDYSADLSGVGPLRRRPAETKLSWSEYYCCKWADLNGRSLAHFARQSNERARGYLEVLMSALQVPGARQRPYATRR